MFRGDSEKMGSQWGKDGKVEKGEAYWERRGKGMKREVEGQATRRCKCNWQSSVAAASSSRLWIFIRIIFEIPDFHRRSWWQTNHRPSMTKIAEKMTKYVQGFLFIITCSSRKSGCVCVRNPAGAGRTNRSDVTNENPVLGRLGPLCTKTQQAVLASYNV